MMLDLCFCCFSHKSQDYYFCLLFPNDKTKTKIWCAYWDTGRKQWKSDVIAIFTSQNILLQFSGALYQHNEERNVYITTYSVFTLLYGCTINFLSLRMNKYNWNCIHVLSIQNSIIETFRAKHISVILYVYDIYIECDLCIVC